MGWSFNIGSVAGTAIRIHVTFLLFLAWIFGVSYVSGGPQAAWSGLLFMVLLFLCVLLHEFGHIFTARYFGVMTPDVILLPIGGVARRSMWRSPRCWSCLPARALIPVILARSKTTNSVSPNGLQS